MHISLALQLATRSVEETSPPLGRSPTPGCSPGSSRRRGAPGSRDRMPSANEPTLVAWTSLWSGDSNGRGGPARGSGMGRELPAGEANLSHRPARHDEGGV